MKLHNEKRILVFLSVGYYIFHVSNLLCFLLSKQLLLRLFRYAYPIVINRA